MITPITLNYILGGITLYLLFKLWEYSRQIKSPEVRYVDTSGVVNNPPAFIDVWANRTINFKLGKESIKVCHIPAMHCIAYIGKIAACYKKMEVMLDYQPNSKLDGFVLEAKYRMLYLHVIGLIYKLTKSHAKSKRRYKKELYKTAINDQQFISSVVEQILEYWKYMGKQIALLSQGKTLRMMHGEAITWDSLEMDGRGKILKRPRYVKS